MTQLAELHTASFRGVRFLIGDVSTSGGRKQVVHEFPNSNRREIDDLGLLNKTYSISGLVTTSSARDSLIAALDGDGSGELIHPTFGAINVSAQPYTVTETTRELGVIKFQMSFMRTEQQLFPVASPAKQAAIKVQSDAVISATNDEIANNFEVKGIDNFEAAKGKLTEAADTMEKQSLSAIIDKNKVSIFTKAVVLYKDGLNANMFDPKTLALQFTSMSKEFGGLSQDAQTMFDLTLSVVDFGTDDEAIPQTTIQRIQKAKNNALINDATRFNAMAQLFNQAANIDFANANELEALEQTLEEKYQQVISSSNLSDATNDLLIDLRASVQGLLDAATQAAFKIATVDDVQEQPASILAYAYYGSTDNAEQLTQLNNAVDVSFLKGNLDILTP